MTDRQDQSSDALFASLADRYRVIRELGRGGMATVFLAEDLKHRRPVAIKVMRPEFIASTGADRFLREIEIAARLQHPHIVPLFDSGVADSALFYVMAYEEGETLRDRLQREKQLSIVDALRITRQVADALAHAHDRGVIHRDVKPGNILLASGHAMLADFGIARAIAGDVGVVSSTGIAVGTPTYMSPEQGVADRDLDGRSDVYSAGCVLYEMLVGMPPYSGPNPQVILAAHRNAPLPSVRAYRDSIPESVEQVVVRAMAKVPADRFRNATEFRDTLERLEIAITSQSLARMTPSPVERVESDRVRSPVRAWWRQRWVAAITLILLLTGAAGGAVRLWRPDWLLKAHPKRVVIFPLHPRRGLAIAGMDDIGQSAARTIWYRLASAPGIQIVDASEYLTGAEQAGTTELTIARKRELSRGLHADYLIDGSIETNGAAAVTVMLGLRGVEDTVNIVKAADGSLTPQEIPHIALVALRRLLPAFLEPGRRVDQSALEQRDPTAIVALLAGDRKYRESRFEEAVTYYESALEHDSLLAVAALNAAQAKSWLSQNADAERFANIAMRRIGMLAPRYASYARAIQAYLHGDADAALAAVRPLTQSDPRSTEAWFLLGETYYHLLPSVVPADSLEPLAENAFSAAYGTDATFSPAVQHLMDLAMRRGKLSRMDSLAPVVKRTLDGDHASWLDAVVRCVHDGTNTINRRSLASAPASAVWYWGATLIFNPANGGCARAALRATLTAPSATPSDVWGAIVGTHASLIAAGRDEDAVRFISSPIADQSRGWSLFFIDAAADVNVQSSAKRKADSLGTDFKTMQSPRLWLLVSWYSFKHDAGALRAISAILSARRDSSHTRTDSLFAAVASAHLSLATADTAAALRRLATLKPRATYNDLMFQPWEAFAGEHMLRARILEAIGSHAEAIHVASQIDAPVPLVNLIFLRQSLALRARASLALGDTVSATRYRQRLAEWSADRSPYP